MVYILSAPSSLIFFLTCSIVAVVDGHCSSPKPINSGISQDSVLSPTLFLLYINDLNLTQCLIQSYADDSTLHFSMSFCRHPNQKQVNDSLGDITERLTSDLSLISDWGKENLVLFIASKTQFLHLSTRQNLPDNYPFYFDDTYLFPSSTLYILRLSFTKTFINSPPLTSCRNVASLAIFHCYFHANCPSELANCMLSPLPWPCFTRFSTHSSLFCPPPLCKS